MHESISKRADLIKNNCRRFPLRLMTGAAKRALKKGPANFQEELEPSQHRAKRHKFKSQKRRKSYRQLYMRVKKATVKPFCCGGGLVS